MKGALRVGPHFKIDPGCTGRYDVFKGLQIRKAAQLWLGQHVDRSLAQKGRRVEQG